MSIKPGTKSEAIDLSLQLQSIYDRMLEIADENENRSTMVYCKDDDGKASFGEAFAPFVESFGPKIAFFRRQWAKYVDKMPKRKATKERKKKNVSK